MSFDLHAVISSSVTADEIKRRYSEAVVVRLAQGLSLIPISPGLSHQIGARRLGPYKRPPFKEFQDLTGGLLEVLTEVSDDSPVAYIEGEDFGDTGGQVAAVWSKGKLAFGPKVLGPGKRWPQSGGPIDEALRALGAKIDHPRADEFICVGLGRFRHTQQWIDLPALVDRLTEMDLKWMKQYDWADFHTKVSNYTFGLKVSDLPDAPRYTLLAVGTGILKTLDALPSHWHLRHQSADAIRKN